MSVAQHIPESPQLAAAPAPGQAGEFGHRIRNISRQAAVYFFGTILTAAAGYLFKVYLARVLGAEALGLYTLGMSIVGFLGLFNAFGLPASASRFVAEYSSTGDFERLGSFLRGSFALLSAGNLLLGAAVLMLGPWIAVRFYHAPALGGFFWPLTTIMLLGVLNNFLGQCMAGYRDVARRTLITHFIGTPANIVFSVILISLGLGLGGYLTAQVASAALVLALLGISVWRMTPRGARLVRSRARVEKEVVAFSAVAFALTGVDFLLSQTDKIVLGCFLRPRQVGIYAVAMALVAFVPIALQSVNQIFSPVIAELHASGRRLLLQNLYSTLTKWVLILTLPLAIAMVCLARTLMGIFGPGFEAGARVLMIGTAGQLVSCAVGSVGCLLLMSGNQLRLARIQAANAVLMIILSLALVPRFGITGAALASAITVTVTNVWSLLALRRTLGMLPYHAGYLKLAPASLLSVAAVAFLPRLFHGTHAQWEIAGAGLICAYACFLGTLLFLGLDEEDRQLKQTLWDQFTRNFRKNGAVIA